MDVVQAIFERTQGLSGRAKGEAAYILIYGGLGGELTWPAIKLSLGLTDREKPRIETLIKWARPACEEISQARLQTSINRSAAASARWEKAPDANALQMHAEEIAKVVKKRQPVRLSLIQPDSIEVWERMWKAWPSTVGDRTNTRGSKPKAEEQVQKILSSGVATIQELELAQALYLTHHPNVQRGFVQMAQTFWNFAHGEWRSALLQVRNNADRKEAQA